MDALDLRPRFSEEAMPYWEGLSARRLLLQRCASCGTWRHYPRPLCSACHSFEVRWEEPSGRLRLHSWSVFHHAYHPAFVARVPTTMAIADMDEGVRLHAPLRQGHTESLRVGLPLQLAFENWADDFVIPVLRPLRPEI